MEDDLPVQAYGLALEAGVRDILDSAGWALNEFLALSDGAAFSEELSK